MDVADLDELRGHVAEGIDDAVHAERPVVRHLVVVSAVGEEALALARLRAHAVSLLPDGLVDPVPDAAAHQRRVGVDDVPVFLEVADGVAHRVGVLAHDVRLAGGVPADREALAAALTLDGGLSLLDVAELAALLQPFDRRVHDGVDVRIRVAALPVAKARCVERADVLQRESEAVAVARLVAHRPHEDRRVVAVIQHVVDVALPDRLEPFLVEAEAVLPVAGLVPLDVRLGDHVDAVAVAEVIPAVVVRVVRGAHGVDVEALEERDVLEHVVHRDGAPVVGAALVAVDALELDRLAVEAHLVLHDLHVLEAHAAGPHVLAGLHHERVEVGVLRAPRTGLLHDEHAVLDVADLLEGGVVEGGGDGDATAHDLRPELQLPVDERTVRHRLDEEVVEAHLRRGEEAHVAVDAREAEHVLVLQEAAVAPAVDLHREQVVAVPEVLRHVELARQLGVLGIADLLPVDPHVVGAVHAVEAQEDLAPLPLRRHAERAAVGGDGVVVALVRVAVADGRMRDVALGVPGVRVAHVRVAGRAEAAHLHAARHVDREPLRVVVVGLPEVERAQRGVAAPADLPVAVEGEAVRRRGFEVVRQRRLLVRKRHRVGARALAVGRIDRRVFPVVRRHNGKRRSGRQGQKQVLHVHVHFPF